MSSRKVTKCALLGVGLTLGYNYYCKQNASSNKENKEEKKLDCPFVTIDDEMYQICQDGVNASMNVTSYEGELLPPFLSGKGIKWLNDNFKTNKFDVFIDTYAKSGTTLTIKLVHQILSLSKQKIACSDEKSMSDPWRAVPWLEADVSQELYRNKVAKPEKFIKFIADSNKNESYRIWKSHMSFRNLIQNIDQNGQCKVIHTLRNPKAVFCSYLSFFEKEPLVKYKGDKNTFFEWFCDGTVVHSNYWDHELEWIKAAKTRNNILLITFEEIVKNPNQSIEKVAKFLNISLNKDEIEQIAMAISFKKMKEDNKSSGASILMNKGGVDRWKKVLSQSQSARMDRITRAKFHNSDINNYLVYE